MQKNWYIIYTKPKCEKKLAGLLTKKKIENFCPLNRKQIRSYRRNRFQYEPLFNSYVFVYASDCELAVIRQTDYVISLVYWVTKPAIVKDEEIEIIKEFTSNHQ